MQVTAANLRTSRVRSSSSTSVRSLVIAGFGLLVVILACVAIGASWQVNQHQADLKELQFHSTRASLIQNVEAQSSISALLLQRYVDAGGDDYVEEINAHAAAAQLSLQQAMDMGGSARFEEVTSTGLMLVSEAARAAQLRLQGDVDLARQVLEDIVPIFRDYRLTLEALAADELAQVSDLRQRAENTGQATFYLLVASGSIGVLLGLAVSLWIARSIIGPLGLLEGTARRVSNGDLTARAPDSGPKEFAHLGKVLNEMMSGIESRTTALSEAYQKLKDNNEQLVEARTEAATDPLTGLGNHRAFHSKLREEITKARATGSELGLIVMDLDGFKAINDTQGHLAGDQVLRDLSRALQQVADSDYEYRHGGDELAVLAPGANMEETARLAEMIRLAVLTVPIPGDLKVSASLGVATFPDSADTPEDLVYHADMAMYWAKSTGKNRVVQWDGSISRSGGSDYVGAREQDVIGGLFAALGAKDEATRDHSERCADHAAVLARELGLDDREIAAAQLSARLHDIGKISVPDEILHKPGPLNAAETARIRRHPEDGANMLGSIAAAEFAVVGVLHHHENFDGSGYPLGLAGEDIPLAARIMRVVDTFDAMTTGRPYQAGVSPAEAIAEMKRRSGTQLDPVVLQAFLRILDRIDTIEPAADERDSTVASAA